MKVQERHCNLLKKITDSKIIDVPIKYCANSEIPEKFKNIISKNGKYIALCTISAMVEKDMPIDTAVDLIEKLNDEGYEVLFVGSGEKAQKYSQDLQKNNCKFIDLSNQTSIYELAQILRNCKTTISVDTGTMHFSYANGIPTVCVFYKQGNIKPWAPKKDLYNTLVINQGQEKYTSAQIFEKIKEWMPTDN